MFVCPHIGAHVTTYGNALPHEHMEKPTPAQGLVQICSLWTFPFIVKTTVGLWLKGFLVFITKLNSPKVLPVTTTPSVAETKNKQTNM